MEELQNSEDQEDTESRADAIAVGRLRIEHIDAFVLECRHNVFANQWNGSVEAILEVGKMDPRGIAYEDIFQHHTLVRRKVPPVLTLLEQMQNIIFMIEYESLIHLLFDLYKAAHRQVHDGRSDVARMNRVVKQRARLGWRDPRRRLIHRRHRLAWIGIAPLGPPQREHNGQRDQRQKDDWISADEPYQFGQRTGLFENSFGNKNIDGHPTAHG